MPLLPLGALAGLLATAAMDVCTFAALKAGVPKPPHFQYVGRWFLYVLRGQVSHETIAVAPALRGEAVALPLGHYLIGAALGAAFMLFRASHPEWTWALGLLFGLLTCALPWLFMFPSMGFGLFGLHGPSGSRLLLIPVPGHLIFGLALAAWVVVFDRAFGR